MPKQFSILAAALALGLAGTPALATGVTKTWVSSATGNDTGTCQFTTPCKTFAYAITQTTAGGEIDVKDGGSYGPVTVNEAVSIVSDGVLAAISVPSGDTGITINAGIVDNVILQGLIIDGHGVGSEGIDLNSGGSLTVINCQIRNFNAGFGISIKPAQTSPVTPSFISNTDIADSQIGISVVFSNGTVTMSICMTTEVE